MIQRRKAMYTVLIQGAMESEISRLLEYYQPSTEEQSGGYKFYVAEYRDVRVVISHTLTGIITASASTAIGILRYHPDVVINQGCAGSALPDLGVGKMLVGDSAVYINCFVSRPSPVGAGSDSLTWTAHPVRSYVVGATERLLDVARSMDDDLYFGRLGSGDMYSRECDRIAFLHDIFDHASEDMETLASYKVCEDFGVDHIAFRIISNNELTLTPKDKSTHRTVQDFTIRYVDRLIDTISR